MDQNRKIQYFLTEILVNDVLKRDLQVITYDNLGYKLSRKQGITIPPIEVSKHLGVISTQCHQLGLPLISALVVSRENRRPFRSYFEQYQHLYQTSHSTVNEAYYEELKKVIRTKDWNQLLQHLKQNEIKLQHNQIEQSHVQVQDNSNQKEPVHAQSVIKSYENYQKDLESKIKEADSLGPVSRWDHLSIEEKRFPKKIEVKQVVYDVNPYIIAEVYYRANGFCESCRQYAPFNKKSDGKPYLEIHRKVSFEAGGEDTVENTIAVCPNCRKKLELGQ